MNTASSSSGCTRRAAAARRTGTIKRTGLGHHHHHLQREVLHPSGRRVGKLRGGHLRRHSGRRNAVYQALTGSSTRTRTTTTRARAMAHLPWAAPREKRRRSLRGAHRARGVPVHVVLLVRAPTSTAQRLQRPGVLNSSISRRTTRLTAAGPEIPNRTSCSTARRGRS